MEDIQISDEALKNFTADSNLAVIEKSDEKRGIVAVTLAQLVRG